jgi:CBS domain containing-hemolysin-like protein
LRTVLGLALLGVILYASTLSYALRSFSRARLAERLGESRQRLWLERLDRHETGWQLLASFVRLLGITVLFACLYFFYPPDVTLRPPWLAYGGPAAAGLLILVVFALAVPHAIALHAAEAVLARSLQVLWGMGWVLLPVERALMAVDFVVRRLLGKSDLSHEEESERMEQEILEAVSEGELLGAVDQEQKEMIRSVFEFHETTVAKIMTPRTDIVAIPADATFEQARETIVTAGHSRVPVYEKSLDHIVGVLYAKDLLRLRPGEPFDVTAIMRSAPYVPETKTLDALLQEFRASKVQIAIVLDEYGGTAGLATIEDILEEIVGEIDDEYDQQTPPAILRIDDDTLELDARVHVSELNRELGLSLPEDQDYDTVGGFLFSAMGKIPVRGEEFTCHNAHFRVLDAEPRRINRIRVRVLREVGVGEQAEQ